MKIRVKTLPHFEGLELPRYETALSSGMDLRAAYRGHTIIQPGDTAMIPTGLCIAVPGGLEAQVRPRSGLAAKYGVTVLNAPGTIDADYRGEIRVLLTNLGRAPFTVNRGDRIAQLVVAPVVQAELVAMDDLDATERGEGGFGSTGQQ